MIVLQRGMTGAAVGVDHDAVRAVEGVGVLRPAVAIDNGGDALDFVEAGFEEQAAGAVLMLAGAMARRAGDEDDFFIGGLRAKDAGEQGKGGEQFFHVRNELLGFLFVYYEEKSGIGFGG